MTADLALSIRPAVEPPRAPQRAAGAERDAGAAPPQPAPAPATPNPRLRLDGSLGMVVIEFRDTAGGVANTIPSPRQMEAYRAAVVSNAPVPVGVRARPAPGPAVEAAPSGSAAD
ncbi:hypothetical protein [Neoroseomonas soli]|uniref:Uncharacterized protein n=1 Tax=Neoroseomonas soli TaxID=1081025 RepID=A0A9X9X0N4_9PROT|nr:hypothetical protein [Neoroseomonas soli]MBR0672963.1 hypothetical protein [Neoroseomonas soli]